MHEHFTPRFVKRASDGSVVVAYESSLDTSWYAGRAGDPAYNPFPMGSFPSSEAARRWADQTWPGGEWRELARHEAVPLPDQPESRSS